jgi:hypothetical protein
MTERTSVDARIHARTLEHLAELERRLAAMVQEQEEALEREQATAEVLRVISRSPEDLDVALQARPCSTPATERQQGNMQWTPALLLGVPEAFRRLPA